MSDGGEAEETTVFGETLTPKYLIHFERPSARHSQSVRYGMRRLVPTFERSSAYAVVLSPTARRVIGALDGDLYRRILDALEDIGDLARMASPSEREMRHVGRLFTRIGEFEVEYDVNHDQRTIVLLDVHRAAHDR